MPGLRILDHSKPLPPRSFERERAFRLGYLTGFLGGPEKIKSGIVDYPQEYQRGVRHGANYRYPDTEMDMLLAVVEWASAATVAREGWATLPPPARGKNWRVNIKVCQLAAPAGEGAPV